MLTWNILNLIQQRFGKLDVDIFASNHNAKAELFYLLFWNPGCAEVDAFVENWGTHFGLFVPPHVCDKSRS